MGGEKARDLLLGRLGVEKNRSVLPGALIAIPKSVHKERIIENKDIFDFSLSEEDMNILDSLNQDRHYCSWDPTNTP